MRALGPPLAVLRPAALADTYGLPFRALPGGGVLPDLAHAAAGPDARDPEEER